MKAIPYLRVSTDDQRNGADAQLAACKAWAKTHAVDVGQHYVDQGVSGATPVAERPGFLDALNALEPGDQLVVAKRDRLARSVEVAIVAEGLVTRSGATIVSADGLDPDDTPEARLMRGMIDLFAEYERALIKARTVAALRAKKARGERVGAIPYGYDLLPDGKTLATNHTERRRTQAIRTWRAAGYPFRWIADKANSNNWPTKQGARWAPETVRRLCRTG